MVLVSCPSYADTDRRLLSSRTFHRSSRRVTGPAGSASKAAMAHDHTPKFGTKGHLPGELDDPETTRLAQDARREKNWKRWGAYLSERQWGTVREDYSEHGNCWEY